MGGMTSADVFFGEGFAATRIPVRFVTEWSHKPVAAAVEEPATPFTTVEAEAMVTAPSLPAGLSVVSFASNPLLVSHDDLWDG
jgi:hypothetical protein